MFRNKFRNEVDRINNLSSRFKFDSTDGFDTISVEALEYYLTEIRTLTRMVNFTKSNGKKNDSVTLELFQNEVEVLKGKIYHQYMRNFGVYDNTSVRSNNVSDIPDVVKKVKEQFVAKINEAHSYFGKFIEGSFHFGFKAGENLMPHSIEELLKAVEKTTWDACKITSGFPQVPYQERFNKILNKAIKSYVEDFLAK